MTENINTQIKSKYLKCVLESSTWVNVLSVPVPRCLSGALNGSLSRPHSESSGEFSLSLDQEVWSSSGSSPTQQHARSSHQSPLQPRRALEACGSPAQGHARKTLNHDVLSLQQFLDEGIEPAEVRPRASCITGTASLASLPCAGLRVCRVGSS